MKYCPHCKCSNYHVKYAFNEKYFNYKLVECDSCSHNFTLSEDNCNVQNLYNTEAYVIDNKKKNFTQLIQRIEYNLVIKKIINFLSDKPKDLIDFGSGKGLFLSFAKANGFTPTGIETAKERAIYCESNYNIPVIQELYDGKGQILMNKVQVITMFHVLEHINNPEELLDGLWNLNLDTGGILLIEVPNFSSLQSFLGNRYWLHLDISRHINHYTYPYILNNFKKMNRKILKIETFSLHLGVIGMLQSLMSVFGYRRSLIEDIKFNMSLKLVISICILIVPATILEVLASIFNRGGIIRIYLKK